MSDTLEDGPYVSDPFAAPLQLGGPTQEAELEGARRFMDTTEWGMRSLGLSGAADNLARYRSGDGGTREYDDNEIARYPILLRAEDTNRTRFESQTFMAEMRDNESNLLLRGLADGETVSFSDEWSRRLFSKPVGNRQLTDRFTNLYDIRQNNRFIPGQFRSHAER